MIHLFQHFIAWGLHGVFHAIGAFVLDYLIEKSRILLPNSLISLFLSLFRTLLSKAKNKLKGDSQ